MNEGINAAIIARFRAATNATATLPFVLAHGGVLSLHDRQPHGLVVRMQLPVHQQSQRAAA